MASDSECGLTDSGSDKDFKLEEFARKRRKDLSDDELEIVTEITAKRAKVILSC